MTDLEGTWPYPCLIHCQHATKPNQESLRQRFYYASCIRILNAQAQLLRRVIEPADLDTQKSVMRSQSTPSQNAKYQPLQIKTSGATQTHSISPITGVYPSPKTLPQTKQSPQSLKSPPPCPDTQASVTKTQKLYAQILDLKYWQYSNVKNHKFSTSYCCHEVAKRKNE